MKLLLLGNTGQLGWELERTLQPLGQVVALDFPGIDMAAADSIRKVVRQHQPQVIVNATAYTAVDKAESEPELAHTINATGPGVLAEEARRLNAALIHYSTDYVFDGTKGTPYVETDLPHPLNVYGQSKLAGEQAIQSVDGTYLILRTAWVYSLRRESFVSKVLQWARQHETLRIVDDQVSNPTWARMLAESTAQVIAQGRGEPVGYIREKAGLYNLAGGGFASRLEWAKEILKLDPKAHEQVTKKLVPADKTEFPSPAIRPHHSSLNCILFTNSFGLTLPDWCDVLRLAIGYAVA
jgi:dTDP-4-dehydrorhamnose reductase